MTASNTPTPTGLLSLPDGRDLAWDEHGPVDGLPVFYLHGIPGYRGVWSGSTAAAHDTGVRLIVPDRPGCGLSSYQPDRRITDWPADLTALADRLGLDRYRIVGLSGGGPYALACAAAGDPRLDRVVVCAGVGPLDGPDAIDGLYETNRFAFEAAAAGIDSCRAVIDQMLAGAAAASGSGQEPDAIAAVIESMPPEDRAVVEQYPDLIAATVDLGPAAVNGTQGLAYDLWLCVQPWGFDPATISIPVDFYAADHDHNVPLQHLVDQAAVVPDSTLTVWPASGHLSGLVRLPEVLHRLASTA